MSKSMKKLVVLAMVQTALGVEATPTPAANSILVRATMPQIINAEFVERHNIQGYKGNFGSLAVGVHRAMEMEVELAGSGAAGTAPKWAPLLLACGFSETLLATTSATYAPVSSGEPVLTMLGYLDGLLFKMTDCKGTVSFEFNSKNIPVMKFKFMGVYSTPTDTAFPTGMVYSGFVQPLTVGKANTPTFTWAGYAAVVQNLGFDVANSLVWRDLINFTGANSADRKPTGSLTMELPSVAALNLGEITRLGTTGALALVHGVTAGNIIQVDMPKTQLTAAPTITNDNEIAMVGLQYSIQPSTGNDELVIVAR
jgi:hypothetical protein